ncbi:hypothetical protein GCK72_004483 [Caenorhabditis remanei]|uniref:HRDC domain-containing protein n=1 Tax=Caenorhabditis remanei TaxID=31234 RepID=A0A6A5HCF8_CAERE|nr:hypothetical protein GCK72_004483 [Caenorhabditis remanei]KAF1764534.1 hypothetical protein GCK72_004483 [Caenorhabditis remanei]
MLKEMLFIVISIFLGESINAATSNSNDFDREQLNFINALNTQRQEIATSYYTVNMQKLVWNKELQSIAEQYNPPFQNQNFRIVLALDYTNGAQHLNTAFYIKYCGRKPEDQHLASNVYHNRLEHLNPLQTIIGCAKRTETWLGAGYTVMCLVGPSPVLQIPSCTKSPSICTSGFKHENGFCSNSDLPDSDQVMYISALNEKRRQIATEQHIANMYELVWNKTLHDIA